MNFKYLKPKKAVALKTISCLLAVVMLWSLMPLGGVSLVASAAEAPVYDPALGEFSENGGVLTATPYENAGFRGWYDKNGNEVSIEPEFTIPSGAKATDYTPVFYNFNLAVNGGFEEYASGTSLKTGVPSEEVWEGICSDEANGGYDWTTAVVSSDRARTGKNSLKAFSQFNTTYHDFCGLEPNVQYTISFWYNLDSNNQNYLHFVSVLGEEAQLSSTANSNNGEYLAHKTFSVANGSTAANEWKKASLTFYTGNNTTVRLAILYNSYKFEDGTAANAPIYIDDLAIVKDVAAAPDYINEDFTKSIANWKPTDIRCVSTEYSSGRLKSNSLVPLLGYLQSPVIKVKKGADYTLTFNLDMSEIEDAYVPKIRVDNYSTYVILTDESLISEDNPKGYVWDLNENGNKKPNWINFSFATEYLKHSPTYNSQSGTTVKWTITDVNGVTYSPSGGGFGKGTLSDRKMDVTNPLTVTGTFTAMATDDIYLNTRLNGLGTYYIDNVKITENSANVDKADLVKENTLVSKGTAIRTTGKQGMRNKTTLDKALLTAENNYGIRVTEYGTLAIKTDYLNGEELVLNGEYSVGDALYGVKKGVAYSFANKTELVFENRKTSLDFTGVLINIAKENWNTNYTARAYVKYKLADGGEGVIYGDSADIAVYPISKMAYTARNSNGAYAESAEVRNYLYKNIISQYTDKTVTVNNASDPIFENFQGIRSTVYHATTFFPDSHGRTYTDEEAAMEMNRLVDSNIDNVRTRFASQWAWKNNVGWDWNSAKMQAIYKWAKMLADRDISITINASWHLSDFVLYYTSKGHSSIPEVNYLHGYSTDNEKTSNLYGEDENAAIIEAAGRAIGLNLTDDEYAHYSVAAARYGEWMSQALEALKSNGVNNVEYLMPFTETGATREDDATYCYDEWILMTLGLHLTLKQDGIRDDYKLIGPSQSLYRYMDKLSLLEYLYEKIDGTEYEDLIDVNSSHAYTKPNTNAGYENTVFEPNASFSMAEDNFSYYDELLTEIGQRDKDFWCDEFFAYADDIECWEGVDMQAVQLAVGVVSGANNGINRLSLWQMFDCLWDSAATHGTAYIDRATEFIGGVHACGTCPSFIFADGFNCPKGESCACYNYYEFSSYTPRTTYYGANLLGKYLNNENASVYGTSVANNFSQNEGGLFTTAIKNDEGKTVILVVNTENEAANISVNVQKKTDATYTRYTYESGAIFPTDEALSIPSDKEIGVYGKGSFNDVIPARSFSIYVSNDYGFVGDDSEIPLG